LYNGYKLFYIVRNFFYLIYSCIDLNNFLLESLDFLYLLFDIIFWYFFKLNLILNMNSLLDLRNNLRNILLDCLFNDSLNYLSHWLYLHSFCVDINWHCSFDVDWDWHFNWLENNSINKLYFSFLNWNSDYFIDMHCYRNLLLFNNHSFFDNLMNLNISSCLQIFHQYLISG
jgi:hypothetical protein